MNRKRKEPTMDGNVNAAELIQELYQAEYKTMFFYAYNILDDKGLSETAVQETFLVALQKSDQLAKSDNPAGWVYNALKYVIRHISRERQHLLMRNISLCSPDIQSLSTNDKYDFKSINTDSISDMDLLIEHYLQGFPIKEIAAKHGITIGNCKMRMKRERDALEKNLKKS